MNRLISDFLGFAFAAVFVILAAIFGLIFISAIFGGYIV